MITLFLSLRSFTLTLFIILLSFCTSNGESENHKHDVCSYSLLSCGMLKDVGYPFWGSWRPPYCGHPDLQLKCQADEGSGNPVLTVGEQHNGVDYEVLGINNASINMTIKLRGQFERVCPFNNSNKVFDKIFRFSESVEKINISSVRLRHPNLVTLYGYTSRNSRELLLVYEYIPNGTVADHLFGDRKGSKTLSWEIRMKIATGTARALSYLHASDIIHRDVKTNNILLDNNFSVKVADFGLSRLFPCDVSHVSTVPQGTPGYLDPQYHKNYQVTSKSDVYSFGVVLVELISSLPFLQ